MHQPGFPLLKSPKMSVRTCMGFSIQGTRKGPLSRQHFMSPFSVIGTAFRTTSGRALVCVLLAFAIQSGAASAAAGKPDNLDSMLKAVENRYNHAQSLKLDFSETYAGTHSPVQNESGVLFLRKPGRMRWQYSNPPGKLFISDGKEVFLYTPGDQRAQKSKLKESEDMRAPIAFLLGKLNFTKEFKSFDMRTENGQTWIVALPKSENLAWSKVEFLATPDGEIHKVDITVQDQSKLEFTFSNEQLNAPVTPTLFAFEAPPGVQIVEAEQ